jgi:cell division protein FtsQ
MELMLEENPYVKNAEVYVNVEGEIRIDIEQRTPIVRIMPDGSRGLYIDDEGVVLPLSDQFAPMVLPVTGHLDLHSTGPGTRLIEMKVKEEMDNTGMAYIYDLLDFIRFVSSDPFWRKQFVQVYRDAGGEYELIPRVGAHQILFGTMDDYHKKLRNLRLLYEEGFGKDGWNSYSKINLKYSNQVICTKR